MASLGQSLSGQVALITGAAQGIGFAIASALAAHGATIAVVDLQRGRGEEAVDSLKSSGVEAHYIEADLTDANAASAMIGACVAKFGRIDILVNNAVHRDRSVNLTALSAADWDREQAVSLKSCISATKAAEPHFEAQGGGTIINMSSVLARNVTLHESLGYHIVKAGLEHLTRCLAFELGPKNIRINAVAPGLVNRDHGKKLTDDPVNEAVVRTAVPLRRAARASEIAGVVAFLCSGDAAYITGQTLVIDGGLSLGEQFNVGRLSYEAALARETLKSTV